MNRRGFLGSILALGAAPVIVRAESLMPGRGLIVPPQGIARVDVLFGWAAVTNMMEYRHYDIAFDRSIVRLDANVGGEKRTVTYSFRNHGEEVRARNEAMNCLFETALMRT